MMENKKAVEDMIRAKKIERDLKNQKKFWLLRIYLGRTIPQWMNLFIGLLLIILTLKSNSFNVWDIFLMVIAGINIGFWIEGGLINKLYELHDELMELNTKTLGLFRRAMILNDR